VAPAFQDIEIGSPTIIIIPAISLTKGIVPGGSSSTMQLFGPRNAIDIYVLITLRFKCLSDGDIDFPEC
jgi:hypothetical protein